MAEEEPFDLDAIEGLKTPVRCSFCDEQFPFRECRLFILNDEQDDYVFLCANCHEREIRGPFAERIRKQISEPELLEIGERAFRDAIRDAGDDPDTKRQTIDAWVRFQLMKRKDAPPGDPRTN